MEVICLQDEAFYSLINEVVARLKSEHKEPKNAQTKAGQGFPICSQKMVKISAIKLLMKHF